MSISDNSTVAVPHENDDSFKFADEYGYTFNENADVATHRSPYVASKIYSLDVGSLATRFLVHSEILDRCSIPPPFASFAANDQPIALPELDEATAHTLIHYLYSSNYQVPSICFTSKSALHYESYKHATCVYCAAIRYRVPGLDQLAMQKLSRNGVGLPIFDILAVARDHGFPLLPESDTKYSEYIETSIMEAVKKDPEPFRKPDFITKFGGNGRLLQVIWKTVMNNYMATAAEASAGPALESGAETPLAESLLAETDVHTHDSLHQLPSPTESVVDSPRNPREVEELKVPGTLDLGSSTPANLESPAEASLEEVDSSTHLDVASNDDFGLPAIEPTVKPNIERSDVRRTVAGPPEEVKKPEHVRADSVVEEDAVAPDSSFDDAKRGSLNEAVHTTSNCNHDMTKKQKKKSKKKHSSIVF